MGNSVIQTSFNVGEWAPTLNARVDLQKYHSAAALLENFFVDYRGGASTRPGTRYILQAYKSATAVRLIPFQASFAVGYMLEFGEQYIRFYNNGAPVLESALTITGATKANPCVVSVTNSYTTGDVDWVYITGVVGMTQLNGRYFKVHSRTGGTITLYDLFGNPVNSTGYGTYTSGGTSARVYTISSPYTAAELAIVKFAQNVNTMVLCHPNHVPQVLTLVTAINWTIAAVNFGTLANTPTGGGFSTSLGAGTVQYSYVITSVDQFGQESAASAPINPSNLLDLRTTAGSIFLGWAAASLAQSYNIYKAEISYGVIPAGAAYGFIGNATGTDFTDSNISPDFSSTPPVVQNPFFGAGVANVTVTAAGSYGNAMTVTFSAPPAGGSTATGQAIVVAVNILVTAPGSGWFPGYIATFPFGITATVATIDVTTGGVTSFDTPVNSSGSFPGSVITGSSLTAISGSGPGIVGMPSAIFDYKVVQVQVLSPGDGYVTAPTVTISAGSPTATAVATLGTTSSGNPTVPGFFQQRLVLAGQTNAPQTFYMSQPGGYYNFNVSNPIQEDDAITGTIVSGQLNNIKAVVPQPSGLIVLTDKASFLINGGSQGSAVSPSSIVANAQSFNGVSDVPPIVSNYDILYVQSKGSIVRDSSYNFYANVFTGTDISVLSSHLFYGYTILEWAWAEEPFKNVWAVRNDGALLTLTFLKEQEFIGWTHSITEGLFKSIATVTEAVTNFGSVDAVYTVVQRTVEGQSLQYVERFSERRFPNGASNAWCVDSGLQYTGPAVTTFTGGEHLAGLTVTGLADGVVIPSFVMPTNGNFTLATAASVVTVGIGFTAKLQTLAIDLGEPTVQGQLKQISAVTVRVADTLGLKMGRTFDTLVTMKDLVVGNVGSASNALVTNLQTCDARTVIDGSWTVPGQYCIQQDLPFPATILGVIPEITVRGQQK